MNQDEAWNETGYHREKGKYYTPPPKPKRSSEAILMPTSDNVSLRKGKQISTSAAANENETWKERGKGKSFSPNPNQKLVWMRKISDSEQKSLSIEKGEQTCRELCTPKNLKGFAVDELEKGKSFKRSSEREPQKKSISLEKGKEISKQFCTPKNLCYSWKENGGKGKYSTQPKRSSESEPRHKSFSLQNENHAIFSTVGSSSENNIYDARENNVDDSAFFQDGVRVIDEDFYVESITAEDIQGHMRRVRKLMEGKGPTIGGIHKTKNNTKRISNIRLRLKDRYVLMRMKNHTGYLLRLFANGITYVYKSEDGPPSGCVELPYDEKYAGMLEWSGIGSHTLIWLGPTILADAVNGLYENRYSELFSSSLVSAITVSLEGARNKEVEGAIVRSFRFPDTFGLLNVAMVHIWGKLSHYYYYSVKTPEIVLKYAGGSQKLVQDRVSKIRATVGVLICPQNINDAETFLEKFEKEVATPGQWLYIFFRN